MSSHRLDGHRPASWGVCAWLLWLIVGVTALTAWHSMAVLAAAVLSLATCATAGALGWRLAAAVSLVSGLVLQAYLLNLTPKLGVPIGSTSGVVWAAVGLALLSIIARRGCPIMAPEQRRMFAAALVVPVAGGASAAVLWLHRHGRSIGWGMHSDTAYKTRTTLQVIQDGGFVAHRDQPDPLTSAINATWSAQGMSPAQIERSLGSQLLHMVTMSEQAWVLVWLTVSFVLAVIAQRRGASAAAGLTAVLLAIVPWTWFMAGLSASYGFQNVGPTVLVLLATYVVAHGAARHPVAGVTGLIMATVATVMSWAPLAAFPAVWLIVVAWRARHALLRSGRLLLVPGAALLAALLYAYFVTLRDLRSQNLSALGNDGAIPAVSPTAAAALTVLLVALAWWGRRRHRETWILAATAVPSGLVVLMGLVAERRHSPSLWGYYPIKFSWISLGVALLIATATAAADVGPAVVRRTVDGLRLAAGPATVGMCLAGMAWLAPPLSHTLAGVFAPETIRTDTVDDEPAQQIFAILDRHPKSFVTLYNRGPAGASQDGFMNLWLFQMTATSGTDPIRFSAYQYNPSKPAHACGSIATWGPGVTVWTSRTRAAVLIARHCHRSLAYKTDVVPQLLPSLR